MFRGRVSRAAKVFAEAAQNAAQAGSQNAERRMTTWGRLSSTVGADGFPWVNARYLGEQLVLSRSMNVCDNAVGKPSECHWRSEWSAAELREAADEHVMLSWTASNPVKALPVIERGEGVYLYDTNGKKYLDWTSQAVCVNLGHTEVIKQGINEQLDSLPYVYGGLGLAPVRAKLAKLLAEICPGDLTGRRVGGGEANEAAIRLARLYTRKHKIFTQYRSYHGASASSLGATGDFRRKFAESGQNGFVKFFNPQPNGFSWGTTDYSATQRTLACLEEDLLLSEFDAAILALAPEHALQDQILAEGPETIAAVLVEPLHPSEVLTDRLTQAPIVADVLLACDVDGGHPEALLPSHPSPAMTLSESAEESIVGAGGVLVPPEGYMEGLRALCDKYDILLICDEVMVGFGRTGHFFGFQHFEGVVPDIVTSAKGLTASFMPLSMVGVRQKIKDYFMTHPIGWGSTFHAHPVALACAYETVKYVLKENVLENVRNLEPELQKLTLKHASVRQARAVGLFGCLDLQTPIGQAVQRLGEPSPPAVQSLRKAMFDNGLFSLFRPPLLHCSPPLIINEDCRFASCFHLRV
eukprot:s1147_g4.t1